MSVIKKQNTAQVVRRLKDMKDITLKDLADDVRERMIFEIDINRKRDVKQEDERYKPKPYIDHIKDNLQVHIATDGSIGVGDIRVLNRKNPYWLLLNFGGKIKGHPRGYFGSAINGDDQGDGKSSFTYDKSGPRLNPDSMEGIHYIEKTIRWATQNLKTYIDKAIKDALSGKKRK